MPDAAVAFYGRFRRIPPHTQEAIRAYVEDRMPPGEFLHAVLSNNLFTACGKADADNRAAFFELVAFVHFELPIGCIGSSEAVADWLRGGADPGGPTSSACPRCDGTGRYGRLGFTDQGGAQVLESECAVCNGTGRIPDEPDDCAPCPDGQHRWIRRRMGGPPDAAESLEVVEYCDVCGIEKTWE